MNFDDIKDRRGTYCTQWDYIKDRFGKEDLLPFTISDMDLESPDEIAEALIKRINHKYLDTADGIMMTLKML